MHFAAPLVDGPDNGFQRQDISQGTDRIVLTDTVPADHRIRIQFSGLAQLCNMRLRQNRHGDLGKLGEMNHPFFVNLRSREPGVPSGSP